MAQSRPNWLTVGQAEYPPGDPHPASGAPRARQELPLPARPPRPRFLAAGQGNGSGYTSTPLRELPLVADEPDVVERISEATDIRDEPECIGPAIVDGYAEVAQFQHSQQHQADVLAAQQVRPLLKAEDRLRDIKRRAKGAHVDLSHEMHIMRRDIEKARLRNQPEPERVRNRLTGLEGLLDGIAA